MSSENSESDADGPLVSFVVATYNRADDLADVLDSILDERYRPFEIVVVSNSTDETSSMFEPGARFDHDRIRYYHFDGRMGVPQARNVGFDLAEGEYVVTLDDDAVLTGTDAARRVVSLFDEHDDVDVLAFQCRDYYSDEIALGETPDPPAFEMTPADSYRATNFVGVGNAIRRSTFESVGGYPDHFVYGFEEMDLSLRIHDTGADILYTPSIVVKHKGSNAGRITDLETRRRLAENRIKLAVRNLPWRYVFFTALVWSTYALVVTRRLSSLVELLTELYSLRSELLEERAVVDAKTIRRIKSRNTMLFLWYYGPHPLRIFGRDGNVDRLKWEI
ncbi:glycosyltransferase family 2 protein [Halorubellus salinus]|uniref:glycosyltransferase family 2 protein n=1 Tax=Halorubellus salinus TaxID=755309 RepID=UPI001D094325|nr:glycosyltransferase [Halorubellus salinus]